MKRYTEKEIEALTNWDGLLCKPPWKNEAEKRQYYSRYVNRMLWRYFSEEDWRELRTVINDLRVEPKLKRATEFLLERRLK